MEALNILVEDTRMKLIWEFYPEEGMLGLPRNLEQAGGNIEDRI